MCSSDLDPLDLREDPPSGAVMHLDEMAPDIGLPMDRPLFSPPLTSAVMDRLPVEGPGDIPADALFGHVYVDKTKLTANIRRALQQRPQISLQELVEESPIEQGLAEVLAYFSLAAEDGDALIDDAGKQTVAWTDAATGERRQATMPLVIYTRTKAAPAVQKG